VPRPRLNLIRYHGVLAPNAKWRSQIVPQVIPDPLDPSTYAQFGPLFSLFHRI